MTIRKENLGKNYYDVVSLGEMEEEFGEDFVKQWDSTLDYYCDLCDYYPDETEEMLDVMNSLEDVFQACLNLEEKDKGFLLSLWEGDFTTDIENIDYKNLKNELDKLKPEREYIHGMTLVALAELECENAGVPMPMMDFIDIDRYISERLEYNYEETSTGLISVRYF